MTRHDFFLKRLNELGMLDKDSDYGGMIGECIIEISILLNRQKHSGSSIQITMELLNKLFDEWDKGLELTPEQIKNWRSILCGMIGPYALVAPDSEIQKIRDKMQAAADKFPDKK